MLRFGLSRRIPAGLAQLLRAILPGSRRCPWSAFISSRVGEPEVLGWNMLERSDHSDAVRRSIVPRPIQYLLHSTSDQERHANCLKVAQVICSPDLGPAGWLFRPRRRAREPANPLLAPGSGQSSREESCLAKGLAWHAARSRLHSSRVSFSSERASPLAIRGQRPSEAVVGVT